MKNFEELLQKELDKLPYTKHLDDGQYNAGQIAGFELGARWLLGVISTVKCVNCNETVKGVSKGEFCPKCFTDM